MGGLAFGCTILNAHQGRCMKGRTPADVFVRCLPKPKAPKEENMKKAA